MPNDVVLVDPFTPESEKTEQDVVLQRVSFGLECDYGHCAGVQYLQNKPSLNLSIYH